MMMPLKRNQTDPFLRTTLIFSLIALSAGCGLLGTKPSYTVNQYTLEYASPVLPVPGEMEQTHELIRVENFTAGQAFDTSAMVYQEGPQPKKYRPLQSLEGQALRHGDGLFDPRL